MSRSTLSASMGALLLAPHLAHAGAWSEWTRRLPTSAPKRSARVLTKPPAVLESIEAPYPQAAIDADVEGIVEMRVTISEAGRVTEVEVTRPLGYGLDEAAVAALERFTFSPAEINHAPAPVRINYHYRFTIERAPAPIAEAEIEAAGPEARQAFEPVVVTSKRRALGASVGLIGGGFFVLGLNQAIVASEPASGWADATAYATYGLWGAGLGAAAWWLLAEGEEAPSTGASFACGVGGCAPFVYGRF